MTHLSSPMLRKQQGAFSIMTAFLLLMLMMFLALILDSGRLYLEQRKLQKIADTAALGALLILPDGHCATDYDRTRLGAVDNAATNGFHDSDPRALEVHCASLEVDGNGRRHAVHDASGPAVEVTAFHRVPSSLILQVGNVFNSSTPREITLRATAVAARDEPVAVFTVGSQLLRLNNSKLLGTLLTAVGLKPETLTLLDSIGLANASITPSGLLAALGVNVGIEQLKALSPEGLVDLVHTKVGALGITKLIDASIQLVDDSVLKADLTALQLRLLSEAEILKDLNLHLFGTPTSPGLLSLSTDGDGSIGAALDARINLGDLLSTSLLIGAQGRALAIGAPDASGAPTEALGLLNTVTLQAGVVEPPSIGVGPVGTTAYNAQVRLKLEVNTSAGILGPLLELLGTSIHLPIIVDLANASGEVTALSCDGPDPSASIELVSAIGSACIGNMPADTLWSTRGSCVDNVRDLSLVRLLSLNLLSGSVALPLLRAPAEELVFRQEDLPQTQSGRPNPLHIGTLIDDLVKELLGLLGNANVPEKLSVEQAVAIADLYLNSPPPAHTDSYTYMEIEAIRNRLQKDKIDWDRPIFLFSQRMSAEWAHSVREAPVSGGCFIVGSANPLRYTANCVRDQLVQSLQSDAKPGLLGGLINGLVGKVLQPLLVAILGTLTELLEALLNAIGEYILTPLLADLLGLELNRTDVTVESIGCGAPRLVQ